VYSELSFAVRAQRELILVNVELCGNVTFLKKCEYSRRCCFCRYYFKCACNDFNTSYVYEEVSDDGATLPLAEGKICAKVVQAL
jgi:DIX domain